jgi:hypothetical protein
MVDAIDYPHANALLVEPLPTERRPGLPPSRALVIPNNPGRSRK